MPITYSGLLYGWMYHINVCAVFTPGFTLSCDQALAYAYFSRSIRRLCRPVSEALQVITQLRGDIDRQILLDSSQESIII